MTEYNFKPDYKLAFNENNLTKLHLIWLIFGINPRDAEYQDELNTKANKTHEEQEWSWAFQNYCERIHHFLSEQLRHCLNLLESNQANTIIQEAYEGHFFIDEDCKDYAIKSGLLTLNPDLEKYKNHSVYELKTGNKMEEVQNENQAFGQMLGVDPVQFDRFMTLDDKCKNEPKDEHGYVSYVKFKPDDKWFYSQYGDFIGKFYDSHHTDITRVFREIKKHFLWGWGFNKFCQDVYDEGFLFRTKTYEHLKHIGVNLDYSEDEWAYKFYSEWLLREPLWSTEMAAQLYLGNCPLNKRGFIRLGGDKRGEAGHALVDSKTVIFLDEKGVYKYDVFESFKEEKALNRFISRHIAKGNLTPKFGDKEGEYEFDPLEITSFFKTYCPNTHEPKALFKVLGIDVENNESSHKHNSRQPFFDLPDIQSLSNEPVMQTKIDNANDNEKREKALVNLEAKLKAAGYDLKCLPFSQEQVAIYLNTQDGFKYITTNSIISHHIKKRETLGFKRGARGANIPSLENIISTN